MKKDSLSYGIDIDLDWEQPKARFERWGNCEGFRHVKSELPHGFVKWVSDEGKILEGTFKNGHKHGLQRFIQEDGDSVIVFIELYCNSDRLGYFWFDKNFRFIDRWDPKKLFEEVETETIKGQFNSLSLKSPEYVLEKQLSEKSDLTSDKAWDAGFTPMKGDETDDKSALKASEKDVDTAEEYVNSVIGKVEPVSPQIMPYLPKEPVLAANN